jgi:hypothetical protein
MVEPNQLVEPNQMVEPNQLVEPNRMVEPTAARVNPEPASAGVELLWAMRLFSDASRSETQRRNRLEAL